MLENTAQVTLVKVHAVGISRLLNKEFSKSTSTTTLIKGAHNRTAGYKVEQERVAVKVTWEIPSGFRKDLSTDLANQMQMLESMIEYLNSFGYNATITNSGARGIWVTKN